MTEKPKDPFVGEFDGQYFYRGKDRKLYPGPKPDEDLGFPLSGSFSRTYQPVTGAKYKARTPTATPHSNDNQSAENTGFLKDYKPNPKHTPSQEKRARSAHKIGAITGSIIGYSIIPALATWMLFGPRIEKAWYAHNNPQKAYSRNAYMQQQSADRMVSQVMRAMSSQNPYGEIIKMQNLYGRDYVLDGMVLATVGSESKEPMPTDVSYEKYLRVLSEKTGKDFYNAYKDRDPKELKDILYNNTINPVFLNDPTTAALVIGGQAIERMTGNEAHTRHAKILEESNLGGVRQFKKEFGRYPNANELDKAMRYGVMNENMDRWGQSNSSTVSSWHDSYSHQSGETTTYRPQTAPAQPPTAIQRGTPQQNTDRAVQDLTKAWDSLTKAPEKK